MYGLAISPTKAPQHLYNTDSVFPIFPYLFPPVVDMAPLAAISGSLPDSAGKILDAIEVQFKLDDVALTRITTQFLQEIADGLAQYGQAMAIMFVQTSQNSVVDVGPLNSRSLIQPNFRHRSAIGEGEGVSDPPSRKLLSSHTHSHRPRRSPAPSSL